MNQAMWETMDRVYEARAYDTYVTYSDIDPAYLQSVQGVERLTLEALRRAGVARRLGELEILDYGCGNAKWKGRWLAWGPILPNCTELILGPLRSLMGKVVPQSGSASKYQATAISRWVLDVVSQNLVFANMLEYETRKTAADELVQVLAPGGLLLWYDLKMNNPKNPNVRKGGSGRDQATIESTGTGVGGAGGVGSPDCPSACPSFLVLVAVFGRVFPNASGEPIRGVSSPLAVILSLIQRVGGPEQCGTSEVLAWLADGRKPCWPVGCSVTAAW